MKDCHKTDTTLKHKVETGNGAQASPPSHLAHGAYQGQGAAWTKKRSDWHKNRNR